MFKEGLNDGLEVQTKIGIDIGGTNTRLAAIDANNQILELKILPTNGFDFFATFNEINTFIKRFEHVSLISLCVPGGIDYDKGLIIYSNNLPGWAGLAIVNEFEKEYQDIKVKLMNDARAAAMGQYEKFKSQPNAKVLFFTTISTGIGSSLINEGQIFNGFNNLAGEVSYSMLNDQEFELWPIHGIEYYCSGTGIMKNYPFKHSSTIQELFASKNEEDLIYLETVKKRLAAYLATAIGFYNPGLIVVGGSVAENNVEFMESVFKQTKAIILPQADKQLEFKVAKSTMETTLIGLVA